MKSKKKRLISLLVTLCMVLTMAIPSGVWADAKSDDIVILYTNDVHTYIDGELSYDVLAGMKAKLKESYNHVLLVDAGDHIQGTAYGSMDKGKTIIDLMNATGYDLATLGNHEFDYGMDGRINVTDVWAAFPYISCNFYHEAGGVAGDSVFDASKTFDDLGKWDVKFVGITTPESFTKSTPAYFQDENGNYIYGIAGGEDGKALYDSVQTAIGTPEADDIVIALGHLGDDPSSQPWTSEEVIANTAGFDAFIDGHSHSTVEGKAVADKNGENVLLTQTGEYFDNVGMMVIDAETGDITTKLISAADAAAAYAADANVKAIKDTWMTDLDAQLGAVIGKTSVVFDNYDGEGKRLVRTQETNTGDFAADALYYLFDNMDMDVDVAIMNGGGVRNKAITGDISYKTCKEIHTFGNVACLQTVTGQQILDALEWGAKSYPNESGGFLHPSGLTYDIDTSIPSTVQQDDKGVWTGGPTGEYRVKNVQIYDKALDKYVDLDLAASYNLAGYNYTLRDLGDGFAMFDGAVNVLDYVMEDYLVLANYVKSFPVDAEAGLPVITAENSPYGEVTGEGRIELFCGHNGMELTGVKEATCTEAGYTGDGVCALCGETVKGEAVEALGHSYENGACTVCGEAEPQPPVEPEDPEEPSEAVQYVYDAYVKVQEALESMTIDEDFYAAVEEFYAATDAFNELSEEELEELAELMGVADGETAWMEIFVDWININLVTIMDEVYQAYLADPSEENAEFLVDMYDSIFNDPEYVDEELMALIQGFFPDIDEVYADAKATLEGNGDADVPADKPADEDADKNDKEEDKADDKAPATGDDAQMLFWLAMMAAGVVLSGMKCAKREN